MLKSSQESLQTSSDDTKFKCLFFICVNDDGDIDFEFNWGNTFEEVKIFANLLVALTNKGLNEVIIQHMKETCAQDAELKKKFEVFYKTYKTSTNKIKGLPNGNNTEVVIDPTQVEL